MTTEPSIPPPSEVSTVTPVAVGPPVRTGGGASRLIDLTGKQFGRLIVLSRAANSKSGRTRWNVQCSCGGEKTVDGAHLREGMTKSCGCLAKEETSKRHLIDLTGRRYGLLTVVSRAENSCRGAPRWHVICDCGTARTFYGSQIRSGKATSCGCQTSKKISDALITDLSGLKFGRLTVLSRNTTRLRKGTYWDVLCDCGEKRVVRGHCLSSGETTSCGCYAREAASSRKLDNLIGRRFGRLTVLARAPAEPGKKPHWLVRCDCGNESVVRSGDLRFGGTSSCGCFRHDQAVARTGAMHPSWNPELSEEDRGRRRRGTSTSAQFATVAQRGRRRDHATCLVCGAPRSTHVHHLEPWALNRNLRYNPANLVTLCKECHDQFHYLYGKDAGLDEFEKYLEP